MMSEDLNADTTYQRSAEAVRVAAQNGEPLFVFTVKDKQCIRIGSHMGETEVANLLVGLMSKYPQETLVAMAYIYENGENNDNHTTN